MGAWGYEPFENDSALDWFLVISRHVESTFRRYQSSGVPRGRGRKGYATGTHEALAACVIVIQLPELARSLTAESGYARSFAEAALGIATRLLRDEHYTDSWEIPAAYERVVRRVRNSLLRLASKVKAEREAQERLLAARSRRRKKRRKAR